MILPWANRKDVDHDVPREIKDDMQFFFVKTISEGLEVAFGKGNVPWRRPRAGFLLESRLWTFARPRGLIITFRLPHPRFFLNYHPLGFFPRSPLPRGRPGWGLPRHRSSSSCGKPSKSSLGCGCPPLMKIGSDGPRSYHPLQTSNLYPVQLVCASTGTSSVDPGCHCLLHFSGGNRL